MDNLEEILEDVKGIARKAGNVIMSYYGKDFHIEYKAPDSPLTKADIESNKIIIRELKKYGYGILSEELADDKSRISKKRVWIVDPMDGTSDFVERTDEFTVMIGLAENGKPILGVVYMPVSDIFYYAIKSKGAYMEKKGVFPKKLAVSKISDFFDMAMLTSRFHLTEDIQKIAGRLGVKNALPCGSAGLKISYIAEKKGEISVNTSCHTWEWDICATDIILSEAGGKLTDTRGYDFIYNKNNPRNENGYVASNGILHKEILQNLN